MRKFAPEQIGKARSKLTRQKIFTFDQLLTLLNCSVRYGRLKLKEWRTFSSYNKNGRYYTVPSVPFFDENGLWRHDGILFSKHRNLINTIIFLVNRSSSGLTGLQMSEFLGIPARSFLHHFRNTPGLQREKHGGVYVYFSQKQEVYKRQIQNRLSFIGSAVPSISQIDAVILLVALIKRKDISMEELMELPEVNERGLSADAIHTFLLHYGLQKKTPVTRP